jgi:hypothetical protein
LRAARQRRRVACSAILLYVAALLVYAAAIFGLTGVALWPAAKMGVKMK